MTTNPLLSSMIGVLCSTLVSLSAASLEVDKTRSRIQVDIKATGHAFTGELTDYQALVAGDAATLKPSRFALSWDFTHFTTAEKKRDEEMIQWLGGGVPKGSFAFTKTWTDKSGKNYAMGTLTVHGVSKTISFPYTTTKDGNFVTTDGSVAIDYQDFNLPLIRTMAVMKVDPKLVVRFHVVGKLK